MAGTKAKDDVFLLYNEHEGAAQEVASALRELGIPIYFYRTDFPYGGEIQPAEGAKLERAPLVLVLLGDLGWGPTHRELAAHSVRMKGEGEILPALIGNPSDEAFREVDGLFHRHRWFDLREPTPETYRELAAAIREVIGEDDATLGLAEGPRFDEIMSTLVDGSDADRAALLDRVIRYGVPDRARLAARLRDGIEGEFSPERESQFATAVRDPKRLASTRSWMLSLLIWLEPLSDESMAVITNHVLSAREPDRAVRFWTLAGIVQRRLPYLPRALKFALDDPAREVAGLAMVAETPIGEPLLRRFRSALRSRNFETAWHVLRVLRIVSIVELAEDVVAQLDRSAQKKALTYDALFALASEPMAEAARPIIQEKIGLEHLAELVLREARVSTSIAILAFARVLAVFGANLVQTALQAAAKDSTDRRLVRELVDAIATQAQREGEGEPPIPGHATDKIDISKDDIGIGRDVQTLASVMLARDVDPPLAIGLFGEWGGGKSFYIRSIEAEVIAIAARAKRERREQFCADVVQIHFNAWHYVDASLWASLVSHLLDGLSAHLTPRKSPAEQRAILARDLASAKAEVAAAEAERDVVTAQLKETTKELEAKILERERSEVKLRDLRAGDLLALLEHDKALDKSLRDALENVGAPAALESIGELSKVVEESYSISGRAVALFRSLLTGQNIALTIVGIALFFLAPLAIAAVVGWLFSEFAASISAALAKVTVAAGSAALILRQAIGHARGALEALSVAKRTVDERLAAKRSVPSDEEKELEVKVSEARANEKSAAERVAAATVRAQEIESRVAALMESQSLGLFVTERMNSDDYRRHLGLISTIRKDLDGLVARVREAQDKTNIDRIILYIDDVDRCPPDMVVDILQAVHLLLAYDLFVVVVSVDPRWLLRSLESNMVQLKANGEGATATPQDYLEKIFQIPFSVRPMGERGFSNLMRRLLSPTLIAADLPALPAPVEEAPAFPKGAPKLSRSKSRNNPQRAAAMSKPSEAVAQPDLDAIADTLTISPTEAEFAQKLHMLLPTPRSAKRFANIYRLLKASLGRGDLASFQGTQAVPGTFQLPMLLLALLVGRSGLAGRMFPHMLAAAVDGREDWFEAGWAAVNSTPKERRLQALIGDLIESAYFPRAPELVVAWLPQVARFSFNTANMFLEQR